MTKLIGLDVGYGFVKVTDGEIGFSFPSVIGEGHHKSTFSTGINKSSGIDNLKIKFDDQLYFVGRNAIKQSKFAHRDLSFNRTTGETLEVLFYTALSFFCDSTVNTFKVVTGLPVERMHMADSLIDRLRTEKNVTIFSGMKPQEITIKVEDIEVVPQPLGSYWSQVLTDNGESEEDIKELVGVVDIGFKTSDLAAIEDGEYMPKKSESITIGMSTAYQEIASELMEEYNFDVEGYALDEFIIKREIFVDGKAVDISNIVETAFERLSESILVEMSSIWRLPDFNRLILSGGGGKAVEKYMCSLLPHINLASDSITANSRGFTSWAKRLWDNSNVFAENV